MTTTRLFVATALVIACAQISHVHAATIPNLVANFRLDENGTGTVANGTTTTDSVGGITGTFSNAPGGTANWVRGRLGNAIQFNNNCYINCTNNAAFNLSTDITVSAWIFMNTTGVDQKIIAKQGPAADPGGYKMGIYSDNKFEFEIRTDADVPYLSRTAAGGRILNPGTWYHVVGMYSSAGGFIRTYVNGVLDREITGVPQCGTTTSSLYISREGFADSFFFRGTIDDVRIYNRVLTAAEVLTLYNPPVANAGPDLGSFTGTLVGTATDADNGPNALTTTWTQSSGGGTATFGSPNSLTSSITVSGGSAVHIVRLTATDGESTDFDERVVSSIEWDGNFTTNSGGNRDSWSNASNWTTNTAPASSGSVLIFGIANATRKTTNNNNLGTNFERITYLDSGYTMSLGSAVTLNSGIESYNATATTNTFDLNVTLATTQRFYVSTAGANLVISGNVNLGSNTLVIDGPGNVTISGVISGSGNISKTGTGTLTLSGANTYTGFTVVNSGTLVVGAAAPSGGSGALGNATSSVQLGDAGGTADATIITNGFTMSRDINVRTGSSGIATIGNTAASAQTYSGDITLEKDVDLSAANAGGTVTFSGVISGSGGIDKEGAGVVILSNADTYSGTTDINTGTLRISTASERIPNTSAVTVAAGATFDLNNFSETIGSLAGAGSVTMGTTGTDTLTTGGDNTSTTFSGVISATGGTKNLTKTGTGEFTLTNNNTYNGTTTISGGILAADNTSVQTASYSRATTTATVNTATAHGFAVGQTVTVVGLGNSALNGTFTITAVPSATSFRYTTATSGNIALTTDANGFVFGGSATGTGAITVANGGTLEGYGRVSGVVTVQNGGTLSGGDNVGVLATGGTTLQAPAGGLSPTVRFILDKPDLLPADALFDSDLINTQAMSVNAASSGIISIDNSGGDFGTGVYRLFNYTGAALTSANTNFSVSFDVPITDIRPDAVYSLDFSAAGQVNLVLSSATPVTVSSFSAKAVSESEVSVAWTVESELLNFGFHLWRRPAGDIEGRWKHVNERLIPGRLTNATAKTYGFVDRPGPGTYEYRLESVDTKMHREFYEHLSDMVEVTAERAIVEAPAESPSAPELTANAFDRPAVPQVIEFPRGPLGDAQAFNRPEARDGSFQRTISRQFEKLRSDLNAFDMFAATSKAFSRSMFDAGSRGLPAVYSKVYSDTRGVLKIPFTALPPGATPTALQVTRGGSRMNVLASTADSLIVFAPGYEDPYTKQDVHIISGGNDAPQGRTFAQNLFTGGAASQATSTAFFDYHDVYFDFFFSPITYPPWFSSQYVYVGSPQDFIVNLSGVASGPAKITIDLYGYYDEPEFAPDHSLAIKVNGVDAGQIEWEGEKPLLLTLDLPAGVLVEGDNTISLAPYLPDPLYQVTFVHSIRVDYPHALKGPGNLEFDVADANSIHEVTNLDTDQLWVVDASTDAGKLIPYEAQPDGAGGFRARFVPHCSRVLVVAEGREIAPLSTKTRTAPVLPSRIKYLAVGPSQFATGIVPLLTQKTVNGLPAAFVDQEDCFDIYNFGRYGPSAIQAAVRELKPQYLLLVGKTTYNYKSWEAVQADPLCPTFLIATQYIGQTSGDVLFGLSSSGVPGVAVGRFPVTNGAELDQMVSRSLTFVPAQSTGLNGLLVSDANDPLAFNFPLESDVLAGKNPNVTWDKAYLQVNYPDNASLAAAMQAKINARTADMLVYVGHGSSRVLGKNTIVDVPGVAGWTGNGVLMQATCNAHYILHNEATNVSLTIALLTQPQGGAALSIATSTYLDSPPAVEFMNRLTGEIQAPGATWGSALMKAQQWAYQRSADPGQTGRWFEDIWRTESILGDPSLPVGAAPIPNTPPQIVSGPFYSPVPAITGEPVTLGAAATDADNDTPVYTWTLNGDIIGIGSSIRHTFPAAGTYSVKLAVNDGKGGIANADLSITVYDTPPEPNGGGGNGGGDNPNNPDGGGSGPKPLPLNVTKLRGGVNFTSGGRDTVQITGTLALPDQFTAAGTTVRLDLAGAVVDLILDSHGRARSKQGSFALMLPRKNRSAKSGETTFRATLRRGSWADDWQDDGLASGSKGTISLAFSVTLGGVHYATDISAKYSAGANSGRFSK